VHTSLKLLYLLGGLIPLHYKMPFLIGGGCFIPVILATQEAEIRRIEFEASGANNS
jgi:hypothetical protein